MTENSSLRPGVQRLGAQRPGAQRPRAQRPGVVLLLLAVANLVNFYDRTIPAVVVEPIRAEFGLTDSTIGWLGASFTAVYALAGIALGRIADRSSRRLVIAGGLLVWSLFTAGSGLAVGFLALALCRIGVGIGEASYAPAANSLIFDIFPPARRSRAISIFQLGVPVGLLLAFATVGPLVEALGSWRVPFLIAAAPGVLLAVAALWLPEPRRGSADVDDITHDGHEHDRHQSAWSAITEVSSVPTVRWLMLAGVGLQIPNYAVATFLVPLLQRYFGMSISHASMGAGTVLGVAGVLGLLVGGRLADRAAARSLAARPRLGAVGLLAAAPVSLLALLLGPESWLPLLVLLAVGWALLQLFTAASVPVLADVTVPRLRATVVAVYFAVFNIVGASLGPVLAGTLSDVLAAADPARHLSAEAVGLHDALGIVVPIGLLVAAVGAWRASCTVQADHERLTLGR